MTASKVEPTKAEAPKVEPSKAKPAKAGPQPAKAKPVPPAEAKPEPAKTDTWPAPAVPTCPYTVYLSSHKEEDSARSEVSKLAGQRRAG
jgi:cell division septation protein DedD